MITRYKKKSYGLERSNGFNCYWWFVGWWALSFGFHVSLLGPNIEVHLPFGFLRIGWKRDLHIVQIEDD